MTITICEYLLWTQPEVLETLLFRIAKVRALSLSFAQWSKIMAERPKPGVGGLLPEEEKGAC